MTCATTTISSTIGLFYYLRILVAMYAPPGDSDPQRDSRTPHLPLPAMLALTALTGLVFLLGVYPTPLWNAIIAVTRDIG